MNKRRLRLCRQRGWDYKDNVPEIRFGGKWFAEQGFNVGDYIDLVLDGKQIIIRHTPAHEIPNVVDQPREKYRW